MRSPGTILYSYAAMLLVIGLFSVFYNPQHQLGWNPTGRSGLISCGTGAVLSLLFAALYDKGQKWALWAGLIVSFLFLCVTGRNAFIDAKLWSGGEQEKWFRTVIFGFAFLASLRTFVMLGLNIRRDGAPVSESPQE